MCRVRSELRRDARDSWEEYWQRHDLYVNHTPQLIDLVTQNVDVSTATVLEIGVGTGGNSSELSRLGARVIAADYSPRALALTRHTADDLGTELVPVECDARALPFSDGAFDLVFHQGFLEHFRDPAALLREQSRVLRSGGCILVDVPQTYSLYTPYKHLLMSRHQWLSGGWECEFTHSELCSLLSNCGFQPIGSYGRGVFPYVVSGRHQLLRLKRLVGERACARILHIYDGLWHRLERSYLGTHLLQCIGVLARKVG